MPGEPGSVRRSGAQILGDVVPGLVARQQEEERRARVAQRLHKQMGAVLLDPEGGYGRCALRTPLRCMHVLRRAERIVGHPRHATSFMKVAAVAFLLEALLGAIVANCCHAATPMEPRISCRQAWGDTE